MKFKNYYIRFHGVLDKKKKKNPMEPTIYNDPHSIYLMIILCTRI